MRVVTAVELVEILRKHKKWLTDEPGGERADLTGADLTGANLTGANLYRADLTGANLYRADLYRADLTGANLTGADLTGADLYRADLTGANLTGANLYRADLTGADLYRADLYRADLTGANLTGANLYRADLYRADLTGAKNMKYPIACPEEGSFIGFKKCMGDLIVKLEIPEDALRCSAASRKCRCSKAKVLSITNLDGSAAGVDVAVSKHDSEFVYKVNEFVSVDNFETDRWKECSAGIHFFITRQEAVDY